MIEHHPQQKQQSPQRESDAGLFYKSVSVIFLS
jgi:hypothetical protein